MAHLRRKLAACLDPALGWLAVPRGASRFGLLLLFWIGQGILAGAGVALWAASYEDHVLSFWIEFLFTPEYLIGVGAATIVIAVIQTLFLLPVRRPHRTGKGVSLWVTATFAAIAGGLLLISLVMALGDLAWLWDKFFATKLRAGNGDATPLPLSAAWCMLLAGSWLIFTPLIVAFLKTDDTESALARLASRLFLGTVIEAVAIIPLDVMVRRKTSCYCGQGTFFALATCIGLGTLLAGPAAWLPLLARRRKRWYRGNCPRCGYDMSGCLKAPQCPECGIGWRGNRRAAV